MLFGLNRGLWHGLATLKHVAEIIVCNDDQTYSKLLNSSESDIIKALGSHGEDKTPVQQIVAYLEHLGYRHEKLEWFKKSLTLFLLKFKAETLVYDYLVVPYVENQLRSKFQSNLRNKFGITGQISSADWSNVYSRYSDFILRYSTGYAYIPATGGIVGFLVNAFDRQYMRHDSSYIFELINGRGMNQEYGDADYSRASYTTVEVEHFEDLEDFHLLATKIYKLSEFFYKHSGQIYYDVFSRYKFKKVSEVYERIRNMLDRHFDYASLYTKPDVKDINFNIKSGGIGDTEKLALSKKKERDNMISYLDGILEDKIGEADLRAVIREIEVYNSSLYAQHGKKEQRVVLDIGEYKARLKLTNDERLARMISAMCALRDLVKYLGTMKISVFTVPSAIFQNDRYLPRFKSFREYREMFTLVSSLMEEQDDAPSPFIRNDDVYDNLMKETRSIIGSIPLITIKDVLDDIDAKVSAAKNKPAQQEYISNNKLLIALNIINRIRGQAQSNQALFCDKFALANKVIYTPTVDHILQNNVVVRSGELHWKQENKSFSLKDHLLNNLGLNEAMYNEFVSKFLSKNESSDSQVLSFLRYREFVIGFVAFVERKLGLLYSQVITSDLRMYFLISEHSKLFNLPKDPKDFREFEWILDEMGSEYYVLDGQSLEDINSHLIFLYKLMYNEFSDLFSYLTNLYHTKYSPLTQNFNLVDQYVHEIPEAELVRVSFEIYMQEKSPVTGVPNFDRFKAGCGQDPKTGFLFRSGEIYKRRYISGWKYLHSYGFWVYKFGDTWQRDPVTKNDTFGVE